MDARFPPRIFLTGPPGCGKTSVIRLVVRAFPEHVTGFYTEEVRGPGGERLGFDLVSSSGRRAVLARRGGRSPWRVGRYSVFLEPLEEWAVELLRPSQGRPLVILDEVGRMECLSRVFRARVEELLESECGILGTVASRGQGLIRQVREHPSVECLGVTVSNRGRLGERLVARYKEYLGRVCSGVSSRA